MSPRTDRATAPDRVALLVLGAWSAAAFWMFHSAALAIDDWTAVLWWSADGRWVDATGSFTGARPLQPLAFRLLTVLGFARSNWMYVWLWVANLAVIWGFYAVCRRVLDMGVWWAFLCAALWTVNPADVTWSWLTMFQVRVSTLFAFAHILLHERTLTGGGRRLEIPATLCFWTSLLIYEGMAGILVAWPAIAWYRRRAWKAPRALLIPPLAFALYVAARLTQSGSASDFRADRVSLDPVILLERLVQGAKVLVIAWLEPIGRVLSLSRLGSVVVIVGVCGAVAATVWLVARRTLGACQAGRPHPELSRGLLVSGPLLAVAGYLPIILVIGPRLRLFDSRTNEFAAMGASVVLVMAAALVTQRIESGRLRRAVQAGLLVPLLLLGLAVQAAVRRDLAASWQVQRAIWRSVIEVVPEPRPGTTVAFDVGSLEVPAGTRISRYGVPAPMDLHEWDTTNALRLLYEERDLTGVVLGREPLSDGRLLDFRTKEPVDPRTLVVVRLARDGAARLVLPGERVSVGDSQLELSGYDPLRRILNVNRGYPTAASLLQAPELRKQRVGR